MFLFLFRTLKTKAFKCDRCEMPREYYRKQALVFHHKQKHGSVPQNVKDLKAEDRDRKQCKKCRFLFKDIYRHEPTCTGSIKLSKVKNVKAVVM